MRLAREGWPFVIAALSCAAILWVLAYQVPWSGRVLRGTFLGLAAVFTITTLFVAWFFRDPDRTVPSDPAIVVSPADGKVLSVDVRDEPSYMGGPATRITIFLNVFNVHVQRAPVSGTVEHYEYRPGEYLVAWEEKASERNEQASIGIRTPQGPVLSRQIAGLVARRIVTYPREGAVLERGERYGIVRFGSRVDLFIPTDWEVLVEPGDQVRGASSPVARIPEETEQ
jgi:phosphatidylserine decarboxylase